MCRSNRHSTLFHHDLVGSGNLRNLARTKLAVIDVGSTSSSNPRRLRRSIDGNEDHVGSLDFGVDVSGEKEILASTCLDYLKEAWLVNRELISVPSINLVLGDITHANTDLQTNALTSVS